MAMVNGLSGPPLHEVAGLGSATMAGFLGDVAARHGTREALVFDDPLAGGATVRWSYADVHTQARRVARGLAADGVQPRERVGILMGNRPEAVAAVFGIAMAGAVPVMLSTFATVGELTSMLGRAEITLLLTQTALLARRFPDELAAVRDELPQLRAVVAVGASGWDALLAAGDADADRATDEDHDPSPSAAADEEGLVIFTSGTTEQPKGIVHGQRGPALQFWFQARIFRRDVATRMWAALPLFWTAGLNSAMGATLAAGGCWV
ncbi:MAG: AMP-dependent synthetase and ligase, partial [Acidimicrobiales bacterium]|nr:AMP-dependent synthetase and ligase [Acidimicrobiales bacterium]